MKKIIILLALMPIIISCGVSDKRITAYKRATKKVSKASSSESLEMIAYDLSKELHSIDTKGVTLDDMKSLAESGDEDYRELIEAISKAKWNFDEALSDKETVFFMERLSQKDKK